MQYSPKEVSWGSLRWQDLLPNLIEELNKHDTMQASRFVLEMAEHCPDHAGEILAELEDVLQEHCGPYLYFGPQAGDGACFGFWPDTEGAYQDAEDGEINWVKDPVELDPEYWDRLPCFGEPALFVNDHGNMTLYVYNADKQAYEIAWDVV